MNASKKVIAVEDEQDKFLSGAAILGLLLLVEPWLPADLKPLPHGAFQLLMLYGIYLALGAVSQGDQNSGDTAE